MQFQSIENEDSDLEIIPLPICHVQARIDIDLSVGNNSSGDSNKQTDRNRKRKSPELSQNSSSSSLTNAKLTKPKTKRKRNDNSGAINIRIKHEKTRNANAHANANANTSANMIHNSNSNANANGDVRKKPIRESAVKLEAEVEAEAEETEEERQQSQNANVSSSSANHHNHKNPAQFVVDIHKTTAFTAPIDTTGLSYFSISPGLNYSGICRRHGEQVWISRGYGANIEPLADITHHFVKCPIPTANGYCCGEELKLQAIYLSQCKAVLTCQLYGDRSQLQRKEYSARDSLCHRIGAIDFAIHAQQRHNNSANHSNFHSVWFLRNNTDAFKILQFDVSRHPY